MTNDPNEWNRKVIEEFRVNGGKVGGNFQGAPMILIHHRGAKTGTERVNPLMYQKVEGGYAVFASKGGAPKAPDWYHNLVANPETSVEVGTDTILVRARVAAGEERERIWEQQKRDYPTFAEYEQKANREIPVIVFEPR